MKKRLTENIWKSFVEISEDAKAFSDHCYYYNALTTWVNENMKLFSDLIPSFLELEVLLELDPNEYITRKSGIVLESEKKRLFLNRPPTINLLLMSISNTLLDMVAIEAEKACPICIHGGLRYFVAQNFENGIEQIILECESCAWTQKLDGTKWDEGIAKVRPANERELRAYGVYN